MKIAIIGCGLIGEKRAKAVAASCCLPLINHEISVVFDLNEERSVHIAKTYGKNTVIAKSWQEAASFAGVDIVIVSTTNNMLAPIALVAVQNKKHVLVEKPCGISSAEISFCIFN